MSDTTKQRVVDFIAERLRKRGSTSEVGDTESLFSSGLMDSIDAMATAVFLESEFGLDFAEIGFSQSMIDSINAITTLVTIHRRPE